jgi:hypothetical protein
MNGVAGSGFPQVKNRPRRAVAVPAICSITFHEMRTTSKAERARGPLRFLYVNARETNDEETPT